MQLWRLTATDLAALIRSGQVSAREAARDALDRLEAAMRAADDEDDSIDPFA